MANSFVRYTGDGNTASYSIPFSYRSTADLTITLAGVASTAFTLNAAGTTLTFNSAPANGTAIEIRRKTSQGSKLVDYASGSVLTENDLDTDSEQAFFMSQEAIDDANDVIKPSATNFQWDATNKRIINVTDPTDAQDVATKNYLENTWLSSSDKANINTLAGISGLSTLAANNTNINTVATNNTNVTNVGSNITNVNTVANNIGSVNTVAADITKVVAVANDLAETVSEVQTVADDLNETTSEIDTVANNIANVNTVGNAITNVNNVGNNIANVNTVATNLTDINSFENTYKISTTAPTGVPEGTLWFDTASDIMKVYDGSAWANAGSSVNGTAQRFKFVATSGQTTFTGTDANGNTLIYDSGYIDVYLNGVHLDPSDYTATNGSSIVMGNATSTNDEIYVVAFGTFNVASINAGDISSGTLNDARLPTTMASKTLTSATVTGTINANTLVARGDGSSADGKITLNCSQNSHGVAIQSPAHSAGQSYTLILPTSVGTNGQVLATAGSSTNQLTWVDAQETKPTVANVSQTIAPATATTITITGTNFVSIPQVDFVNGSTGAVTRANTVSFTNATTLSVNCTLATGNYYVRIENPDGNAGRSTNNIITASTAPTFTTNAGSLGSFAGNFSGNLATIAGTSDSAVTFSEVGSNLTTANVTLSSAGVLATTDFGGSSTTPTQYNFTIRITDAEGQTADRAFSLTSTFGATGGGQFN